MEPLPHIVRARHEQWGSTHQDLRAGDIGMVVVGIALREAGCNIVLAKRDARLRHDLNGTPHENTDDLIALLVEGQLVGPQGEDNWDAIARNKCAKSLWSFVGWETEQTQTQLEDCWVVESDMVDRVHASIPAGATRAAREILAMRQAAELEEDTPQRQSRTHGPRL